mmetsp:Transcript_37070/g.119476  ORF Transcript_37070/g.119476 Transcript_37070/m.119476 type:complete len:122 (-) Transcript_37070:732-1097(-)
MLVAWLVTRCIVFLLMWWLRLLLTIVLIAGAALCAALSAALGLVVLLSSFVLPPTRRGCAGTPGLWGFFADIGPRGTPSSVALDVLCGQLPRSLGLVALASNCPRTALPASLVVVTLVHRS